VGEREREREGDRCDRRPMYEWNNNNNNSSSSSNNNNNNLKIVLKEAG